VECDRSLVRVAGELTGAFALKASDAIHLASAQAFVQGSEPVVFGCWDRRLWAAAQELGFEVVPAS